jgi:hypothetical protein
VILIRFFFAMSSKYENLFMVFFKDFYITYSLKSVFEVKHTRTF